MTDEHAAYLRDMTEYLSGILSTDEIGELASAADRIEALIAENAELRDLLHEAIGADAVIDRLRRFNDVLNERDAERALADQLADKLTIATLYIDEIDPISEIQVALRSHRARRSPKEPTP